MLYAGTDPESYITENTLVNEDKPSTSKRVARHANYVFDAAFSPDGLQPHSLQGYLVHKKAPPPSTLCLGSYGGPRGLGVSYERGTPVLQGTQTTCSTRLSLRTASRPEKKRAGVQGYLADKACWGTGVPR